MDALAAIVGAAFLSALAGYGAGRKRVLDHRRELNKIGALLGLTRGRAETNDEYAARLLQFMQAQRD